MERTPPIEGQRTRYGTLLLFLAVYGAALLWLAPKLSLWLDEVLDLIFSQGSFREVIERSGAAPGGVPLGYLMHWASFALFDTSAFSARLPSLLASIAACAGVFLLARRVGMRHPILAVAVFAAFPLQFHYALEARPYAAALAISVWIMVLFEQLLDHPKSTWRWATYGLLVSAGLYMQPYSLFIPAAQWVWTVVNRRHAFLLTLSGTLFAAALSFAPWYAHVAGWTDSVQQLREHGEIGFRSLLLIAREITGFGYAGLLLTLIGVIAAARAVRSTRLLWLLYIVGPIAGALAADAVFDYFLAIRQMIFAVTPLAIGFALGIETLQQRGIAAVLAVSFLGGAVYANTKEFLREREDWQNASQTLQAEVKQGACALFVPADFEVYYTFFAPDLSASKCAPDRLSEYARVAVAFAPGFDGSPAPDLPHATIVRSGQPAVKVFTRQ